MSVTNSPQDCKTVFDDALAELTSGRCIGLPTETVYGLAADATNGLAVASIFDLKQRPKFNPLICHVSGLEMARAYGEINTIAEQLIEAFWPGPLTLVVPTKADNDIHPLVSAQMDTIALRQPKGIAGEIISAFGKPLAAPSGNVSGRISPTTAQHITSEFPAYNLLVLDEGACSVGIESTILKVTGDMLTILRPGFVTAKMIENAIGIHPTTYQGDEIEAPGMMKSHYAPNARVLLNQSKHDASHGVLAFGSGERKGAYYFNLSESGELCEAAANLYKGMKALDDQGCACISVEAIPNEGLGIAINDRLGRAAAPRGSQDD